MSAITIHLNQIQLLNSSYAYMYVCDATEMRYY